ncbi:MAG: hypothetical protein U9Q79_07530 [Candidatus Hydrogenedentes bacterium]|nr:hypothetical protein [Candidatus Hydrogenedentota bacterium]
MNAAFRATGGIVMLGVALGTLRHRGFGELWVQSGNLGLAAAFFFWLAGMSGIKAVQLGHLGITWTVVRCSMIIPTLASLLVWREVPLSPVSRLLVMRVAGVAVITGAVICLGIERARTEHGPLVHPGTKPSRLAWGLWLTSAFLAQGGWEITLRATRSLPDNESRLFYFTVVCVTAGLLTLPLMFAYKARFGRLEILYGVMAGVCSVIASGIRPFVLRDLDGIIVFPITTVSVTLLVLLAGAVFWHERLGKWGAAGIVAAVLGMLLLTLSP